MFTFKYDQLKTLLAAAMWRAATDPSWAVVVKQLQRELWLYEGD